METYKADEARYADGMKYRRCGNSGILLPEISLGLWQNFGDTVPYASSRERVLYAFDRGVTHFDLANNYGPQPGSAEETFGKILKDDLHRYRDELFISTKAGYEMWPGPYGNWGSRKYLMSSLDQSLKRMGLDYVDIFYIHRFDPETCQDETLQTLADIVAQGKALYIGISRYPYEETRKAFSFLDARSRHCLLYQGKLNIFDREPLEEGILGLTEQEGTGFIAFSPLAQGLLTERYLDGIPEDSRAARDGSLKTGRIDGKMIDSLKALKQIACSRGQSLAEMSLSWVLSRRNVTSVIIGASSKKQIEENLKAIGNLEFSMQELEMIDSAASICRHPEEHSR